MGQIDKFAASPLIVRQTARGRTRKSSSTLTENFFDQTKQG